MADSTRKAISRPANAGEVGTTPQKRLGASTERRHQRQIWLLSEQTNANIRNNSYSF